MPPKQINTFLCFCPFCSLEGGSDSNGQPLGVRHLVTHRVAHLKRVKAEAAEAAARQSVQTRGERAALIEQITADAFTEGLLGDDSTVKPPSRLWSRRQPPTSGTSSIYQSANPPVDAVLASIVRLQSASITPEAVDSTPIHGPSERQPLSHVDFNSKAESNRATKKAHMVLDVVKQKIETCMQILTDFKPGELSSLESEVSLLQKAFDSVKRKVSSVKTRKDSLRPQIKDIQSRLREIRSQNPIITNGPVEYDSNAHFDFPINSYDPVAQISMFIAVVLNVMAGVSRRMGDLVLGLLSIMLRWSYVDPNGNISTRQKSIVGQIPATLKTALKKFSLDPVTTTFAVCPECHCTYAPKFLPGSDKPIYPTKCSNNPTPDTICTADLLDGKDDAISGSASSDGTGDGAADRADSVDSDAEPPLLKKFIFNNFDDYLANLLARKDLEDYMDAACDDLMASINRNEPIPDITTDAFQSEYIRTFAGPDSDTLFVDRPKDEGRYLFALNVDFFSAEGQTIRGPSASCGLISAACLNLPLHLRYKPENMYIAGIVPGPKEPSLTQFNHYIRPIIDTFLSSWNRGVRFSRTANYPKGRTTRCAIAIAVNDLPAARTLAQMGHHTSHHFCSRCKLVGRDELWRTDITDPKWGPQSVTDLRKDAEKWISARTGKDRDNLTAATGCRWTELWRLPYWDPTRMLAVDSMHCILEGITQHHFRYVLDLTETGAKAAEKVIPAFQFEFSLPTEEQKSILPYKEDVKHIPAIHALLLAPLGEEGDDESVPLLAQLFSRLCKKNLNSLRFVAESLGVIEDPSKRLSKIKYANALIKWRSTYQLRPPYDPAHQKLGTLKTLDRIHDVIRNTDTPSWLESVPKNFGYAAAGSLKADEWRTMATVYLPVALVSLWGEGTAHPSPDIATTLRRALDHTMLLVSAVTLACMRTMTVQRMEAYRDHVVAWKAQLTSVHPSANHTPNSHMAIHIYDFLRLFGPVRSWWCFPFERLIGQLQRLPSNHKFGELETSMLHSFTRGAKLRQWLSRPDCPPFLRECKKIFDKSFGKTDNTDPEGPIKEYALVPVPDNLRTLINASRVVLRARHKQDDVMFSRNSTHVGNSLVMFYPEGSRSSTLVPGSIQYIIARPDAPVIYAVRRQLPSPKGTIDPFMPYPHFRANIHSTSLSPTLELVQPEWVFSHYARYHLDSERAAILPLSRD